MRVLCFGDSITQGFWDSEGGWVARTRKYFDENVNQVGASDYVSFFNLGIDGNDTAQIIERLPAETEARISVGGDCSFIIQTGTNDSIFRGDENFSSPEVYARQLETLLATCREYSSHIYLVSLFPVDDSKMNPMPWSTTGKCYSTERMKQFNDALEAFCKDNDTKYISIWHEFEKQGADRVLADGVHPNAIGHQLIADAVVAELKGAFV